MSVFFMQLFSVQQVHCELRKWLHANTSPEVASKTRIIYGGAVMNLDHIILLFICFSSLSLSQSRFLVSSFFLFLQILEATGIYICLLMSFIQPDNGHFYYSFIHWKKTEQAKRSI